MLKTLTQGKRGGLIPNESSPKSVKAMNDSAALLKDIMQIRAMLLHSSQEMIAKSVETLSVIFNPVILATSAYVGILKVFLLNIY
jgi:hypothetical protein